MEPANPKAIEFTSFEQVVSAAVAPRRFQFELNGGEYFVNIRPLNAVESAELERITDRVQLPHKDGAPQRDDPKYLEAMNMAWDERRAGTLDLALLSFKVEGNDLKQKARFIREKLPPGVPHQIFMQILEITSNPIQNGVFTTSADSQSIPS